MRTVLNLLGEDVAGVDLAGDMVGGGGAVGAYLSDLSFAEVNMLRAFVGKGRGPQNCIGVVVVNSGFVLAGFSHPKIGGAKFDSEKFKGAFVGGVGYSLA